VVSVVVPPVLNFINCLAASVEGSFICANDSEIFHIFCKLQHQMHSLKNF
jgi:hypothetical protein